MSIGVSKPYKLYMFGLRNQEPIYTKQYDTNSRFIDIELYTYNNEPYIIPFDAEVRILIKKHNGEQVWNPCTDIELNKLKAPLTEQTLAVAGTALAEIYIKTTDSDIRSQTFPIAVEAAIGNEDSVLSSNEFGFLEQRIQEIDNLEQTVSANEQLRTSTFNNEMENYGTQFQEKYNGLEQEYAQDLNQVMTDLAERATKTELQAVASGSPKGVFLVLSDLQAAYPTGDTNIYVVAADGNWYYWNNSDWVSGGVYQSTGLGDESVSLPKMDSGMKNIIDTIYKIENDYPIDNLNITTGIKLNASSRWFIPNPIKSGYLATQIDFVANSVSSTTITVEFWNKSGDILTKVDEITYSKPNDGTTGIKGIPIEYNAVSETYISLTSTVNMIGYVDGVGTTLQTVDKTSSSLTFSVLNQLTLSICAKITSYKKVYMVNELSKVVNNISQKVASNIINVGSGMEYETIQEAVDNCNDSETNHVTIMIHPGVYSRFSLVQSGSDINSNAWPSPANLRYISIIGVNKRECIIRDDTGEYPTPPAEIRTNGIIKNLTFIATHENAPAQPESDGRKAYAIHIDFGAEDLLIEDCVCISYQAPAIGIGLHQDEKIHLKNCELYSYATADLGTLLNYGALYCHSDNDGDNITGQELTIENCRIYSQNANKAALFQKLMNGTEFNVRSINSTYYSYAIGAVVSSTATLTPDSHGNNVSILNAI